MENPHCRQLRNFYHFIAFSGIGWQVINSLICTVQEFFNSEWFAIFGQVFTYGQVFGASGLILFLLILYYIFLWRFLPSYFYRTPEDPKQERKLYRILHYILLLLLLTGLLLILDFDRTLYESGNITLKLSTLFHAFLILQLARLFDWVISRVFLHTYFERRDKPRAVKEVNKKHPEESASRTVQVGVYIIALILIIKSFELDFTITNFTYKSQQVPLNLTNILAAILTILVARLLVWVVTQIFLYSYYKREGINVGSQYAFNQLLKYVIYTLAILIAIGNLGVNPTLIWGGLAALAVGVGLGLQQTFNDFFSGIILLFERSVEVGDVLEVEGYVGSVKKIGIRASLIEARNNITIVMPNSKLVTEDVINWSHFDNKVRFHVKVSVAYGSDTQKVKELLLEVAGENPYLMEYPAPFVRFTDFGDSGLAFELHFWSRNFNIIEDIKSDLRFKMDDAFRKHGINIPFPQRDIWIRSKGE